MQRHFREFAIIRSDSLTIRRGFYGDSRPALVVAPAEENHLPHIYAGFENELSLVDHLDSRWAAVPIELTRHENLPALAVLDPGGDLLDAVLGRPLNLNQRLAVALSVIDSIKCLHERGIAHTGLNTRNVLVSVNQRRSWILGFGAATRVRFAAMPSSFAANTSLSVFLAPEQLPASNRYVDRRADLYAFGVMLHMILEGRSISADRAGRMPFELALEEGKTGLPPQLVRIVGHLLETDADDRYQTAAAVQSDLGRCLRSLDAAREIPVFAIGVEDAAPLFRNPDSLFGRDEELATLVALTHRVAESGKTTAVLIAGGAGTGKSALVDAVRHHLTCSNWLVAAAKFDQQQREYPFRALNDAVQSLLASDVLDERTLNDLRRQTTRAVGRHGKLVTDAIPVATALLGSQPAVPEVGPNTARNRLHEVLANFIQALASPLHPLLLFLDDIQWTDAATLDFVADILTRRAIPFVLFIGASREADTGATSILRARLVSSAATGASEVHILEAEPLGHGPIGKLIAAMLDASQREADLLLDAIYPRVLGNPLFTIQLVRKLVDERIITRNVVLKRWEWNQQYLVAALDSVDLLHLMTLRLQALPEATRETLQFMSCIGNAIQMSDVTQIAGLSEPEVHARLEPAVMRGLINRRSNGYSFTHDRVQEAVYRSLGQQGQARQHREIAQSLKGNPDYAGASFDVVDHINRAASLLHGEETRYDAAVQNLNAALAAKEKGAYLSALQYIEAGRCFAEPHDSERKRALHSQFLLEAAHCQLLSGNLRASDDLCNLLLTLDLNKDGLVKVYSLRIMLYVMQSRNDEAADIAVDCLRELYNVAIPRHPSEQEAREACLLVFRKQNGRSVESLAALPEMTDHDMTMAMNVLASLLLPSYYTSRNLFVLHLAKMVEITLDYGITANSAHAFASFGVGIGNLLGLYEEGYQYGTLAKEVADSRAFISVKAKTLVGFGLVSYWTRELHTSLNIIQQALLAAAESGEFDIACTIRSLLVAAMLAIGIDLDECWREAEAGRLFGIRSGYGDLTEMMVIQLCFIAAMQGRSDSLSKFDSAHFSERKFEEHLSCNGNATLRCMYWTMKGKVRYLAGDFDEAAVAFEKAALDEWALPGFIQLLDLYLFWGMTCAALEPSSKPDGGLQAQRLERLRISTDKLSEWSRACPSTFSDKRDLLLAELARLEGRDFEALSLYEAAIRHANDHGFAHYAGIVLERAACFCRQRHLTDFATSYLQRACHAFAQWGALAKVRQLDPTYVHGQSADQGIQREEYSRELSLADMQVLLDSTHAISGEVDPAKLIQTILELAARFTGAIFGAFVHRKESLDVVTSALRNGTEQGIFVTATSEQGSQHSLPVPLIEGVFATRKAVTLDAAAIKQRYRIDATHLQNKSVRAVLCLPMLRHGQALGVLYLEADTEECFLGNKVTVLQMMIAQAAISIEIAQLYTDVSKENLERRRVEASLRDNEAALAQAQRIGGIASWQWDVGSGLIRSSDQFRNMLEIKPDVDNFTLENFLDFVDPGDREMVERELAKAVQRRQGFRIQYRGRDAEGKVRYFQAVGELQTDETEQAYYVGATVDVSEREWREQALQAARSELAHMTRVHTLGQLASSIAHEVNQPLSAILTNATGALRWLKRPIPDLDEIGTALERIVAQGNRASNVISNARGFVKSARPRRTDVDLRELITETLTLLQREIQTHNITLELSISDDIPGVHADRVQFQQVLTNLLMNAIEALHDIADRRRIIIIRASAIESRKVAVVLSDNGPGVQGIEADQLFNAFFSTKPDGLGMGLSICRSILEAHDGELHLLRIEPPGAAFKIILPLSPALAG